MAQYLKVEENSYMDLLQSSDIFGFISSHQFYSSNCFESGQDKFRLLNSRDVWFEITGYVVKVVVIAGVVSEYILDEYRCQLILYMWCRPKFLRWAYQSVLNLAHQQGSWIMGRYGDNLFVDVFANIILYVIAVDGYKYDSIQTLLLQAWSLT